MAAIRLNVHRSWEDLISMLIGVLIMISPWMANAVDSQFVVMNAIIVGALVLSLAQMEMIVLRASEEWFELACGLWLTASPFVLGYASSGELRYWHFVLGTLVVLLAVMELWQDWKLSDKQLAEHSML